MSDLPPSKGVTIKNDSGEAIPPNSIVVVTSVEYVAGNATTVGKVLHHVAKYSGQKGNIFVSEGVTIPIGKEATAYADSMLYVAVEPTVDAPVIGEQWGPVSGKWYLSRKGAGFFAHGSKIQNVYPTSPGTYSDSIAIFLRSAPAPRWGKTASAMTAGSLTGPTSTTVNVWEKDYASGATPKVYAVSTHTELLALPVVNSTDAAATSSGRIVKFDWIDNQWMITGSNCS